MRLVVSKDIKRDKFVNTCLEYLDTICTNLQMTEWTIRVSFPKSEKSGCCDSGEVAAMANSNPVYSQGQIRIFAAAREEYNDDPEVLKEMLTHEVIHLLMGKLSDAGEARFISQKEFNESVEWTVTRIARAVYPHLLDKKDKKWYNK